MPNNEVLLKAAADLAYLRKEIDNANDLISFLREAGQDVTKHRQDLDLLVKNMAKFEGALRNRGIAVPIKKGK